MLLLLLWCDDWFADSAEAGDVVMGATDFVGSSIIYVIVFDETERVCMVVVAIVLVRLTLRAPSGMSLPASGVALAAGYLGLLRCPLAAHLARNALCCGGGLSWSAPSSPLFRWLVFLC